MTNGNVCKFVPADDARFSLNMVNYIRETDRQVMARSRISVAYVLHVVTAGEGVLRISECGHQIKCGCVFLIAPAVQYRFEPGEDFEYMYISFIGNYADSIIEELKIDLEQIVYPDDPLLLPLWKRGLELSDTRNIGMTSESILLYTLSVIRKRIKPDAGDDIVESIRKYADSHLSDPTLTLGRISGIMNYSGKYISRIFKKRVGIGFSRYLTVTRIRHSCALIEQGIHGVKDLAYLCGFSNQLYFSSVFKGEMNVSPSEYIRNLRLGRP